MDYEAISHVSEAGIRAYGKDSNEAFANTARGLFSLITDISKIRTSQEVEITLSSGSLEELLVDFLNELLFYFDSAGLLFGFFDVQISGTNLRAKAFGEKYLEERHPLKTQVKATTYYGLEIKHNDRVTIQVYFDI